MIPLMDCSMQEARIGCHAMSLFHSRESGHYSLPLAQDGSPQADTRCFPAAFPAAAELQIQSCVDLVHLPCDSYMTPGLGSPP